MPTHFCSAVEANNTQAGTDKIEVLNTNLLCLVNICSCSPSLDNIAAAAVAVPDDGSGVRGAVAAAAGGTGRDCTAAAVAAGTGTAAACTAAAAACTSRRDQSIPCN